MLSDRAIFEVEHTDTMERRGSMLVSSTHDWLPAPKRFGVEAYWYISFIYTPKELRGKGKATEAIWSFVCSHVNEAIYTVLVNSDITNGTVLKDTFERLFFEVVQNKQWRISMLRRPS